MTRSSVVGARTTITALALALGLALVGCAPGDSSPRASPLAQVTPDPACPPPHDVPDLELALPTTIEGLDGCRLSVGGIATSDEVIQRLNLGAILFESMADATGANLEDVRVALTGGTDTIGMWVWAVDGVGGHVLWDFHRGWAGQNGIVRSIGGRDVLITARAGEGAPDSAAWIDGDRLFELWAYEDLAQLESVIETIADQ